MFVLEHFLYSSLVDGDYLDTERFMTPEASEAREARELANMEELLAKLESHMAELMEKAGDTSVNRARRSVYEDCLATAVQPSGLYTMTVPTGGGKTLSSMAFGLRHAVEQGMERDIVAIPYTSIVEQTAATLKAIFGAENVLEHHSNYDFRDLDDEEKARQRLAIQNWDAPIVVTTNVQLFESLFSNKPGKSRKVHNMARSVIILDEAQTLPRRTAEAFARHARGACGGLRLEHGAVHRPRSRRWRGCGPSAPSRARSCSIATCSTRRSAGGLPTSRSARSSRRISSSASRLVVRCSAWWARAASPVPYTTMWWRERWSAATYRTSSARSTRGTSI